MTNPCRCVLVLLALSALLAGCATQPARQAPSRHPATVRRQIVRLMPATVSDRVGWASDIYAAFDALEIPPNRPNLCSALAVIAQESSFHVHPVVPGLAGIARREINRRAKAAHVPHFLLHAALSLDSPNGQSYSQRLKTVRTEQQLSTLFEDFVDMVPLGKSLFAGFNPVHTAGPMQVSVAFAKAHAQHYPYPITGSIRHEVFTRRGGLYFGVLHLLGYSPHYGRPIYRFADFNAGWYASRNAAFQHAVSLVTGTALALDGDLVRYNSSAPGATELATRSVAKQLHMSDSAIHDALAQGEQPGFEDSQLYSRLFALAEQTEHKPLPRALLPGITLKSPKISRKLTTAWFAKRVDKRRQRCMRRASSG